MRYFNTEPDGKCYRYRHRTKRVEEIISVALWCSRKKIKKNKKAKKLPTITRLFTPSISLLRYTRALKLVVNNQVYEFEKKSPFEPIPLDDNVWHLVTRSRFLDFEHVSAGYVVLQQQLPNLILFSPARWKLCVSTLVCVLSFSYLSLSIFIPILRWIIKISPRKFSNYPKSKFLILPWTSNLKVSLNYFFLNLTYKKGRNVFNYELPRVM